MVIREFCVLILIVGNSSALTNTTATKEFDPKKEVRGRIYILGHLFCYIKPLIKFSKLLTLQSSRFSYFQYCQKKIHILLQTIIPLVKVMAHWMLIVLMNVTMEVSKSMTWTKI